MAFSPVEEILEDIRRGKMVIVCDDEDRENEGDLTMAAERVTPEAINFMASYGRGLICVPMTSEVLDRLGVPDMEKHNAPRMETAFTVTIEAATGVTSGISAADRSRTIEVAADPESGPEDLVMPGHVSPLRARSGGVLERPGQTESAVDLVRLAGFGPVGVICEIMKDDGTMARVPDLEKFSEEHGVKMVTVEQIADYRRRNDGQVRCTGESELPTKFGPFRVKAYENESNGLTHLALIMGQPEGSEGTMVRLHPACTMGDTLNSTRCGCGTRLADSMESIRRKGEGVIVYLQREGAPTLISEVKAYHRHEKDPEAVSEKDLRVAALIMEDLGLEGADLNGDESNGKLSV